MQPQSRRSQDLGRLCHASAVRGVVPRIRAATGSVSFSGRKRGYGDVVIIDHGNGVSTLYAHLVSAAVKAGESIGAGEIVGRAGKRGRATGTHLHFEVRRSGSPIDPVPHLWLDSGGE